MAVSKGPTFTISFLRRTRPSGALRIGGSFQGEIPMAAKDVKNQREDRRDRMLRGVEILPIAVRWTDGAPKGRNVVTTRVSAPGASTRDGRHPSAQGDDLRTKFENIWARKMLPRVAPRTTTTAGGAAPQPRPVLAAVDRARGAKSVAGRHEPDGPQAGIDIRGRPPKPWVKGISRSGAKRFAPPPKSTRSGTSRPMATRDRQDDPQAMQKVRQ